MPKKKTDKWEVAIVINDLHVPFHDPKAVDVFLQIARYIKPDIIFLNGDILDCYDISRFTQNPIVAPGLQKEIDITYNYLKQIRKEHPKARIVYIDGNHEFRLNSYLLNNAKELFGLKRAGGDEAPVLSLASLLRFKELGVEHVSTGGRESYTWYGNQLLIGHWNRVNKHSAYTAKNLVEDKHMSLIHGHTHRLGSHYKTVRVGKNKHREIVGFENGCLCNLNPEYVSSPNWQNGFSVIHKKKSSDRFSVQQIPIIDHTAFYGGVEFNA